MSVKFQNNAYGILAGSITNSATSIALSAGHGARFPVLAAGDYFYATIFDASANYEIVKVTARATDTLTVVRGQDGTAGRAFNAGDRLELRPCNVSLLSLAQEAAKFILASGTGTYTGLLDPVPNGYVTNQVYPVNFNAANIAPDPTLNLNSFGPKTIRRVGGGTVAIGDISAGMYAYLVFNGTDFLLINPNPSTAYLPDTASQYLVPSGAMVDFAGTAAPTGWLLCDGSTVSRTTYSTLFGVVGTTWGAGDGSSTFGLPDFRRRVAVGSGGTGTATLGNAVGNAGGAETHTLAITEMPSHGHGVSDPGHTHTYLRGGIGPNGGNGWTGSGVNGPDTTSGSGTGISVQSTGGGTAHNNLQPSIVVLKIIKT